MILKYRKVDFRYYASLISSICELGVVLSEFFSQHDAALILCSLLENFLFPRLYSEIGLSQRDNFLGWSAF